MGKGMAKNVVKKGFSLTVYDVAAPPVDELVKLGATSAGSPKEVAENSQAIILMVPGEPEVDAVLFAENGILKGFEKGGVVIVMSTVGPLFMRRMAEKLVDKGISIIDAPVVRGPKGAEQGTLAIMAGGDEEVFEDCRPVLETMGSDIFYCGGIGTGEVVKLVNNYLILVNNIIISEGMALGVKWGANADTLFKICAKGSGDSYALRRWAPLVLNRNFEPGMKIDLALKDLNIIMDNAKELKFPLFFGSAAQQVYQFASSAGRGQKDMVSLTLFLEEIGGIEVRTENKDSLSLK